MPGTPTSRGLVTLATSDVITSFATTINTITSSVDTALTNTLQFYNYKVADATARGALTGMVDGSLCFQTDKNELWYYDSGAAQWKIWIRPDTAYTANLGGFGGSTSSTTTGSYSVSGGICYVEIDYTMTSVTNAFSSTTSTSAATGNGTTATYTVTSHPFIVGQLVSVSGFIGGSSGFNVTNALVTAVTSTTVTLTNTYVGTGTGTGTITSSYPVISMPLPYANYLGNPNQQVAGNVSFYNDSTLHQHAGVAAWITANTITPKYASLSTGVLSAIRVTTGAPFTEAWAVNDRVQISFAYPV